MNLLHPLKRADTALRIGEYVLAQAKKNKEIVYGGQALKQQTGFLSNARYSKDYDVYSDRPKQSAQQMERTLDNASGGNNYYIQRGVFPKTWRVVDVGIDQKRNSADDFSVVDYTKRYRPIKTVTINGVRFASLSDIERDKRRTVNDPSTSFRREKDQYDLDLIKSVKRLRGL